MLQFRIFLLFVPGELPVSFVSTIVLELPLLVRLMLF